MRQLACSLIIPVFNERENIQEFIQSIYQQTRTPDEIIIIDGGSTDGTYEYLQEQEKQGKLSVYRHPSNIAQARNFAIEKTHHDIILCTDAGCKVDSHRCEHLMHIYETTDEMVVGGKSETIALSVFQHRVKNRFVSPDPNFHIMSSRNVSFYKKVRREVQGYPEYLTKWGEDTYFNYKMEKAGYHTFYCPQAIVAWHIGKTYTAFYRMYRNYTQGDAEVLAIHRIIQGGSIKQAILATIGVLMLIILSIVLPYGILLIPLALLGIGLYKRSSGGFWFDFRFSMAKLCGTIYGFWRGIIIGYQIKKTMK